MPPKKNENTFLNRVAQFNTDQQKPKQASAASYPKSKKTSVPTSENPYLQARHKILEGYPEWRRNEIQEMEKTGNLDNRYYSDFVHEVAVLGDELSS